MYRLHRSIPPWLEKWTSLVLAFVEEEKALLPASLLAQPAALGRYTPDSARIEADGIAGSRVHNIAITLDKVKAFLRAAGQLQVCGVVGGKGGGLGRNRQRGDGYSAWPNH